MTRPDTGGLCLTVYLTQKNQPPDSGTVQLTKRPILEQTKTPVPCSLRHSFAAKEKMMPDRFRISGLSNAGLMPVVKS